MEAKKLMEVQTERETETGRENHKARAVKERQTEGDGKRMTEKE